MPGISRAVAIDLPHHVTLRGNYRHGVFDKKGGYLQHLEWLTIYSRKYSLKIWDYCLMGNHVHGENMTDFSKGGTQWETKAAKRTKRRARNRRQLNKQRI